MKLVKDVVHVETLYYLGLNFKKMVEMISLLVFNVD